MDCGKFLPVCVNDIRGHILLRRVWLFRAGFLPQSQLGHACLAPVLEFWQGAKIKRLRVRAVFHKTVRVCHVYSNFKLGFTCRITVSFRTLKDGSLLINTLASNICFSYRNMFQNASMLCQK